VKKLRARLRIGAMAVLVVGLVPQFLAADATERRMIAARVVSVSSEQTTLVINRGQGENVILGSSCVIRPNRGQNEADIEWDIYFAKGVVQSVGPETSVVKLTVVGPTKVEPRDYCAVETDIPAKVAATDLGQIALNDIIFLDQARQSPLFILKDLGGIDPRELYPAGRWRSEAGDFGSAGIRLRIKPGVNKLQIAYSQRLSIDERGYGYSSGWPKKGFSGVDYLLYPATSWPLDANFKLTVSAEIPEMPANRLFGKTWLRPGFRSNLAIVETKPERPHVRLLRGEFPGFPADILSILVWFDAKAPRFFSE
jgi:hypothetical protein